MQADLLPLYRFMMQLVPLTEAAWPDMQQHLVYRRYARHEVFVTECKVCRDIASYLGVAPNRSAAFAGV
jgi:hypothetical protein